MNDLKNWRIVERRIELGMTQDQVAFLCGVNRKTIVDLENLKHEPRLNLAIRLSLVLGCEMSYLFHDRYSLADIMINECRERYISNWLDENIGDCL